MSDLTPVRTGARWAYCDNDTTVSFDFGRVETSRSGLSAWIEIRNGQKEGAPLHFGTYNLMGNRTVAELAKSAPKLPADFLREAVYDVISRQLEGEATVDLAELEGDDPPWWLLPRLVGAGGVTHLIAEGGSGKSYLALAACYTIATGSSHYLGMAPRVVGPCLYLDWESTEDTFKARSRALNKRNPPAGVHYQAQKQPLRRSADSIAKKCDELDIVLIVVDSMMLARGGDAFGPEETAAVFSAIREIGRPAIVVDHKSQEAIRKGRMGAYGSIVGKNSIRLTWEITNALQTTNGTILRLKQGKSNDIPEGPDLGFELIFTNEGQDDNQRLLSVTFRQIDPVQALMQASPGNSQADEIHRQLLDGEAHTIAELVRRTGFKTDSIRKALKREQGRFEVVDNTRPERWRLKDVGPRQETLPEGYIAPAEDPY